MIRGPNKPRVYLNFRRRWIYSEVTAEHRNARNKCSAGMLEIWMAFLATVHYTIILQVNLPLMLVQKRKTAYVTAFVYWYCFSWWVFGFAPIVFPPWNWKPSPYCNKPEVKHPRYFELQLPCEFPMYSPWSSSFSFMLSCPFPLVHAYLTHITYATMEKELGPVRQLSTPRLSSWSGRSGAAP